MSRAPSASALLVGVVACGQGPESVIERFDAMAAAVDTGDDVDPRFVHVNSARSSLQAEPRSLRYLGRAQRPGGEAGGPPSGADLQVVPGFGAGQDRS